MSQMILENIQTAVEIGAVEYQDKRRQYQEELGRLNQRLVQKSRPAMIILEGLPGAEITAAAACLAVNFDPRTFRLYTNPTLLTEPEPYHYLHRYWEQVPPAGEIAILEHGWHRRLLHERAAGAVPQTAWKRANREVNQFESQLYEFGVILLKFFIHTELPKAAPEETKSILPGSPAAYLKAANDMLVKTSPRLAPWTVVPGGFMNYTEIEILKTCARLLSASLEHDLQTWQATRADGKIKHS